MRRLLASVAAACAITRAANGSASDGDSMVEAKRYFEAGVAAVARKAWGDALDAFRSSSQASPTKSAAENVGICLTHLGRFDESLAAYDFELSTFGGSMSEQERRAVEQERQRLKSFVGRIELHVEPAGAQIAVDGGSRGIAPLPASLLASVGTRLVRISKPGYAPIETTVRVASQETSVVSVRLELVAELGELSVSEEQGQRFEVRVDGLAVGTTPWEGSVSKGVHTVALRGANDTGSVARAVTVDASKATSVKLVTGPLPAELRVEPTPPDARVVVDGEPVSKGQWAGSRPSGPHRVEVSADWYAPVQLSLTLSSENEQTVRPVLQRVPRIYAEALWGATLPPIVGVSGRKTCWGCGGSGGGQVDGVRGAYLVAPRVGVESFCLFKVENPTSVANVALSVGGLSARYQFFDRFPLTLRFSAGLALEGTSVSGAVPTTGWTPVAGPEVRFGYRIGTFVIDAGLAALLFSVPAVAPVPNPLAPNNQVVRLDGGLGVSLPLTLAAHFDL